MTMRKTIGLLGMAFPFAMIIGSFLFDLNAFRQSISAYYHSSMGAVFVGMLCAQAMFLFAYRGHKYDPDKPGHNFFIRLSDNAAGNIAAIAALGIAIFPTGRTLPDACPDPSIPVCSDVLLPVWIDTSFSSFMHGASASVFFLMLAYICLCLFVQSGDIEPTIQKKSRNRVYRFCGYTMLAVMALAVIFKFLPDDLRTGLASLNPIFWIETVAVLAFGVSWLVKGEAILADIPYGDEDDEEDKSGG